MGARVRYAWRYVGPALFGLALGLGLFGGGLVGPSIGIAADELAGPPRRPPLMPPSVPLGAPEDLALFTYVEKVNQVWGRDWPLVIQLLEEFDARYPNHPVVRDALYVAYVEDAKQRARDGDLRGARVRVLEAIDWDPGRPEAHDLLDELDQLGRRQAGR